MSSNLLQLDTKGMCLLCLSESTLSQSSYLTSVSGFEKLLRYLEVNTTRLLNGSFQLLQNVGTKDDIPVNINVRSDVEVTLCCECSKVIEKFEEVYKQFEIIKLQFDNCVQSVHEFIKNADEAPTRVREYKKKMYSEQPTDLELFYASFAANLRSETFAKCSSKLESRHDTGVDLSTAASDASVNIRSEAHGTPISSIEVRSTSVMTSSSTSSVNLSISHALQPPEMNAPVSSAVSMAGVVESNTGDSNTNSGLTLVTTDTTGGIASADTEIVNKRIDQSMSTAPSSEAIDTRSIPATTNSLSAVSASDVAVKSTSKSDHFNDCVIHLVTPVVESISGGDHNHNLSLESSPLQLEPMDIASPSNEMSGHASRVNLSVSSRYALRQLIPSRNVERVRLEEATQEVARNFGVEGGSSTQSSSVDNHPNSDPCLQHKRSRIECYICDSRFNSGAQLTEHRSVNGRARDVDMCCFCDYTSGRSWGALINHLRSMHTVHMVTRWIPGKGEEPVGRVVDKIIPNIPANGQRCGRCGEEMESFDAHKTHLFVVHFKEIVEQIKSGFKKGEVERQLGLVATSTEGKSNAQLLDDIGSSSSQSGARNARKTHDDYQHMCPTCSKIYKNWELHSHVLCNHPEYLVRHYFPLGLKSECTDERCEHVRNSILPSKVTPCPYCKGDYPTLSNLKKHVVNIHTSAFAKDVLSYVRSLTTQSQDDGETSTESQGEGSKRALVQCEWCGDTFHSREQLTQHKNRNETATETCSICEEPIRCCSTLRDHLRSAHTVPLLMDEVTTTKKTAVSRWLDKLMDDIPTNDHRCTRCGEETGSFEALKRHFLLAHFTELVKQVSAEPRLN